MKNKSLILIIGESTGLECFKNLIKLNYFKIFLVVSVDFNYHNIIKKICKKNYINFQTSSHFKKNFHKINFTKNQKYILLSIFSNLILKKIFLRKFDGRAYNLHPGLLPYYPGKNCVSGALYNDEKETGVSLHLIKEEIDTGAIIKKIKIKILKSDNLITIMFKLKLIGIKIIIKFIKNAYLNKKLSLKKNTVHLKKNFPKKIPNNGLISSKIKYNDFNNLVRASYFGPFRNTWGELYFNHKHKKKYIVRVISNFNISKKKFYDFGFIEKLSNNRYYLRVEKKIIEVLTK
tara:strand:- start:1430 stop:2299 length:870 start_codon:yes stop_codon:yes gene_type:complete